MAYCMVCGGEPGSDARQGDARCGRCGSILQVAKAGDGPEPLERLERFGVTSESRPLLEERTKEMGISEWLGWNR